MRKVFIVTLLIISITLNLKAQELQEEPHPLDFFTEHVIGKIFGPAAEYIEGKTGFHKYTTDILESAWKATENERNYLEKTATQAIDYIVKKVQEAEQPQELLKDFLTDKEYKEIQNTLHKGLGILKNANTALAEHLGFPHEVMAGIMISMGLLGIRVTVPALIKAIPLVPFAYYYGALGGGVYKGYTALRPYLPAAKTIVPYVPVLASIAEAEDIWTGIKNATAKILSFNQEVAKLSGLSPIFTGALGAGIGTGGTYGLYKLTLTLLWWMNWGVYLTLAWPFLYYGYSFTAKVLDIANKRNLSKGKAEALTAEVKRLSDRAQEVTATLIKEEGSRAKESTTQKQVAAKTEL